MSSQTNLEVNGNLSEHPLAELLIEATEANLSGSFRLSRDEQKIIIYLNSGEIVFAASNLRQHRLFSFALSEGKISREQLEAIPNAANDLQFGANLSAQKILSQNEVKKLISRQIEKIIEFCLTWDSGEWTFSTLARIKEGIYFEIDLPELLLNYARKLTPGDIFKRFSSRQETFGLKHDPPFRLHLQSHEGFVLSRFEKNRQTLDEIDAVSGLPENVTLQVLYTLWLSGFLRRQNWNYAFSKNKIDNILSAKLTVANAEQSTPAPHLMQGKPVLTIEESKPTIPEIIEEKQDEADEGKLLSEFLERVENAVNLYEIIGVEVEIETSAIKKAYFAQAKKYHPDLFHKNEEFYIRVQNAFTKLANAYETLKTDESRDLYNYKMRKDLAELREKEKSGVFEKTVGSDKKIEQAAENFEIGLKLLQQNEYAEAVPFFARAVHFNGENARYHAFYGKALSFDKKNLHKAEAEIQTAIKIEAENTTFRLMLAELFIHIGLLKRAEGELNRLLTINPNDRDAIALLDSLQKK